MMIYPILFVYSVIFVELFIRFRLTRDAKGILTLSTDSLQVMKSSSMTDLEKERFMRSNSVTMLRKTFIFIAKFVAVFIVIGVINYLIAFTDAELADAVIASFSSIKVILVMSIITMIYVWIRNVIQKKL